MITSHFHEVLATLFSYDYILIINTKLSAMNIIIFNIALEIAEGSTMLIGYHRELTIILSFMVVCMHLLSLRDLPSDPQGKFDLYRLLS